MRCVGAVPRLSQILVLSAVFVLQGRPTEAADTALQYVTLGTGTASCGRWTEDKLAQTTAYKQDTAWLIGFISAYNRYGWHGRNVTSETDVDGMLAWVGNYCAANPTEPISGAADYLAGFLSRSPHPNDK
jgi:membrane peptidoglycan carboxypeptidase